MPLPIVIVIGIIGFFIYICIGTFFWGMFDSAIMNGYLVVVRNITMPFFILFWPIALLCSIAWEILMQCYKAGRNADK